MTSTTAESGLSIFGKLQADDLWAAALQLGFPSALWKLPHSGEIKLLISMQEDIERLQPDLEKSAPGFIVSPFSWKAGDDVHFLKGDIILAFSPEGVPAGIEAHPGEEHPVFVKLIETAFLAAERKAKPSGTVIPKLAALQDHDSRTRFERTVELAVSAIMAGKFSKVVLSRTKEMSYDEHFQPVNAFYKLAAAYPHAFVSLVNLPQEQELWLGASPETLVQYKADGIFKTMSLAGTQSAHDAQGALIPKYDVRWNEKEIEEQALVSRYIVECFKKIRLREYLETGPKTVLAGNLYHLRTDFEVDTEALHFPELGTVMMQLLHPTSAICGVPKAPSEQFIHEVEGYDRSFYSGYLGPVQVQSESHIFVNLRTVRLKKGIATFFAGAGITADSVPFKEWEETELKCETLLSIISK